MNIDLETIKPYLLPAAAAAFLLLRHFRFKLAGKKLPALAAAGAVFVDVRTPAEFAACNRPGSINILCCASGARSGVAAGILKSMGFRQVTNAGPWQNTL